MTDFSVIQISDDFIIETAELDGAGSINEEDMLESIVFEQSPDFGFGPMTKNDFRGGGEGEINHLASPFDMAIKVGSNTVCDFSMKTLISRWNFSGVSFASLKQ